MTSDCVTSNGDADPAPIARVAVGMVALTRPYLPKCLEDHRKRN